MKYKFDHTQEHGNAAIGMDKEMSEGVAKVLAKLSFNILTGQQSGAFSQVAEELALKLNKRQILLSATKEVVRSIKEVCGNASPLTDLLKMLDEVKGEITKEKDSSSTTKDTDDCDCPICTLRRRLEKDFDAVKVKEEVKKED